MRGEQAIFNLEIKKKSGLSINPNIHHSKVFSSGLTYPWFSDQTSLDIILIYLIWIFTTIKGKGDPNFCI